ncbi:MAG TPA: hypothetical protein VIW29_22335 [Polyangiaceae bacterium]
MSGSGKVARQALRAALEAWLWGEANALKEEASPAAAAPRVRTDRSATLFSGEAREWVEYLKTSEEGRYEADVAVRVHVQSDLRLLVFEAENPDSEWLASMLQVGFRQLGRKLRDKPHVSKVFRELVFENVANQRGQLRVRLSPSLPSEGTRESRGQHGEAGPVRLVLSSALARKAHELLTGTLGASGDEQLGILWPVVSRMLLNLAYPAAPRDLFVTKIDVYSRVMFIAMNVLYDDAKRGVLWPSKAGIAYTERVSGATGIPVRDLPVVIPYFRALHRLGFMLRSNAYSKYEADARIVSRELLDESYLRLSLAGVMPDELESMRAMTFSRKGRKVKTPAPVLGKYGIQDDEDLQAWKAVVGPFQDLGFTLLKQLGMGEFGRVYEALNDSSGSFPERVALKVDRIAHKKKKAILAAEEAMHIGRALAGSPHVMRLYDTGVLRKERFTYHVLQLIDGDTLDNLVGVTGREHASVSRPPSARGSEIEAQQEVRRALDDRGSELWRMQRRTSPFTQSLSAGMGLDLLTSVLLWLEEVHEVGYASNDLKNGNLMMSRRGQLKGIDLDSYGPAHSPKDKMTDFMFLAVSLVLLMFSKPIARGVTLASWEELIESEAQLRAGLTAAWPFGDVERISDGRVSRHELGDVLVHLVQRSRHLIYAKQPDVFAADIVRLMDVKRRLLVEELVID